MPDVEEPRAAVPVPATINVEIVSPSAGVPVPLSFPDLPTKTTVAQLKDMVRQKLTVPDPAAVDLRVIYQGRMLAPPDLTLENALGHDAIREPGKRVLHVVANTSARVPAVPFVPPEPNQPAPPPDQAAQLEAIRRRHMAAHNQILTAHQQARAAMHLNGIQDQGQAQAGPAMNHSTTTTTTTMRIISAASQPGQPVLRAPLPEELRMAAAQAAHDSHLQALRNQLDALRVQGAQAWPPQYMAGGSPVFLPSQQGPAPQQQQLFQQLQQQQLQQLQQQQLQQQQLHQQQLQQQLQQQQQQQQRQQTSGTQPSAAGLEVYILSSPAGPEAILVHSNGNAYLSSPSGLSSGVDLGSTRAQATAAQLAGLGAPGQVAGLRPEETAHQVIERWRENGRRPFQVRAEALGGHFQMAFPGYPDQPIPMPQRARPPRGQRVRGAHPVGHPGGGLLRGHHQNGQVAGALAAAIWPHLWLMIRMAIFIYWFRFLHSESSWGRWFSVLGIALAVLLINTGMLNGVVDQAWQPVREHLDRLMPMGPGPGAPGQRRQQDNVNGAPRARAAEPDPAAAAARMVAARREANGNWLLDQVRRVERAGLLFLASIAPGVAERHIAHLEAEARAERRRQEEAAAAAAAAAAEATAAEAAAAEAGRATETEASGGHAAADTNTGTTGSAPVEGVPPTVEGASGAGVDGGGAGGPHGN